MAFFTVPERWCTRTVCETEEGRNSEVAVEKPLEAEICSQSAETPKLKNHWIRHLSAVFLPVL